MTKNEAKRILIARQQQLSEVKDEFYSFRNWLTKSLSDLDAIFGSESLEYKYLNDLQNPVTSNYTESLPNYKKGVSDFFDNCIDTLFTKGIHKKPKINFLSRFDDKQLITWAIAIIAATFSAGIWFSRFLN